MQEKNGMKKTDIRVQFTKKVLQDSLFTSRYERRVRVYASVTFCAIMYL
jgi:stalled ribosome alternative rescue factor ArfA